MRIVAARCTLKLALLAIIFAAVKPASVFATVFQFDYSTWHGGVYEPFYPMKSTLTYNDDPRTHIAFSDGWYSDDDVGMTLAAENTSLNYREFLEFLTNGIDEEIFFCFGGVDPNHPNADKSTGRACGPISESLLFNGCLDAPPYSSCDHITILNTLDRPVTDLSNYAINEISLEVIAARTYLRYGEYVCLSGCTTWESTVRFTFDLSRILAPPEVPEVVSSDAGDAEILLEISVSDDGGSQVTKYDATCTDGTNTFTGTSTASPITVSGLTNGVAYTCTVTATNSVGTSTSSAPTARITPEEQVGGGLPIWLLYQISQ